MPDLTTAKTRELVYEIERRLKRNPNIASVEVRKDKVTVGSTIYCAADLADLDPQPEPRSLAERARAAMTENDLGGTTLMADELRAFVVATGEAVDALKAQVKFIRDREPWLPDVWRPEVSGPDLLEAAKTYVAAFKSPTTSMLSVRDLEAAIAAEEARRKA